MRTPAYHKSLETLHVNCLEPRAYFIPFADEKTAATRERGQSDYFLSLCGEWDFRFFKSFEDVLREPPEYVGEGGFDKIAVPRSWQTYVDRGYDVPLYSNLEYPFPTDPPFVPDENPCGLYVRKFTLDEKLASHDLFLNFEGVDSCFLCLAQREVRRLQRGLALHKRVRCYGICGKRRKYPLRARCQVVPRHLSRGSGLLQIFGYFPRGLSFGTR